MSRTCLLTGSLGFFLRVEQEEPDEARVSRRFCEGLGGRFRRASRPVLGFQYEDDARRFWAELGHRMSRFGLELDPAKARLLRFGTLASQQGKERGERKPGTFDFLD